MKRHNKILVALAFAAVASGASVSAEISFKNEIKTETYYFGDVHEDVYYEDCRVPGIFETMSAEYHGEKIDVKAKVGGSLYLRRYSESGEQKLRIGFSDEDGELDISYSPVDVFQISFNYGDIYDGTCVKYASGSYFPVLDMNAPFGNYLANLGFLYKPIKGLSIGAGIDFGYIFNSDGPYYGYDDGKHKFSLPMNFGVEYALESIGEFALTFNDVFNAIAIGAYAKITSITDLDVYAGFAFQRYGEKNIQISFDKIPLILTENYLRSEVIQGYMLLTAGMQYVGIKNLTLAFDLATNLGVHCDSTYDLYSGMKTSYKINDMFEVGGVAIAFFDFADSQNDEDTDYRMYPYVIVNPGLSFSIGSHIFKAGVRLDFHKDEFGAAIPISWTWTL